MISRSLDQKLSVTFVNGRISNLAIPTCRNRRKYTSTRTWAAPSAGYMNLKLRRAVLSVVDIQRSKGKTASYTLLVLWFTSTLAAKMTGSFFLFVVIGLMATVIYMVVMGMLPHKGRPEYPGRERLETNRKRPPSWPRS